MSFDATESGLPSLIPSASCESRPQTDVTRLQRRPGVKVRAEAIASLDGSQLARLDPLIDRAAGCTLLAGGVARLPRFVRVDPACTEMPRFSRTKGAYSAEGSLWADSRPTGVAQGTAGIGRRPGIGVYGDIAAAPPCSDDWDTLGDGPWSKWIAAHISASVHVLFEIRPTSDRLSLRRWRASWSPTGVYHGS